MTHNVTGQTVTFESAQEETVTVKLCSPMGEEEIAVPIAVAADDTMLCNLLVSRGVSMAANARVERENGQIKLTKQADRLG